MKYFTRFAEYIAAIVLSFAVLMAGVSGVFQSNVLNGVLIAGGVIGIGFSVFALATKQHKKEVDAEEQFETKKREEDIKQQEAMVQRIDLNAELLTEKKTILIEIPPLAFRSGVILDVRLNDRFVGEMDSTRRSFRYRGDDARRYGF